MPEVIQAPTDNETQQAGNSSSPGGGTATQAHPAEFPQAPQDAPSGSGGQIDILLDMDVSVAVTLGTTHIPVRRLLQLAAGSVLKLDRSVDAPAELYLKDSKFAEAEVVIVDNHFAVRITQIVKAGGTGNPT